jgi:hypothetical protein
MAKKKQPKAQIAVIVKKSHTQRMEDLTKFEALANEILDQSYLCKGCPYNVAYDFDTLAHTLAHRWMASRARYFCPDGDSLTRN